MPASAHVKIEPAARLRQTIARLYRRLRVTDAGTAAGLTPARASMLLNVERNGPMRLSRLAEDEAINPTMLSRMVGDLVEAGLLERESDPADRRAAWVQVTPEGGELARRIRGERTEAMNAALSRCSATDRKAIRAALPALERLAEQLREERP